MTLLIVIFGVIELAQTILLGLLLLDRRNERMTRTARGSVRRVWPTVKES